MKHLNLSIVFLAFMYSCHTPNGPKDMINNARKEFAKEAEEFNADNLRQSQFEDSLYKIAELNLDSGIKAIEHKIIEYPNYAPFHKIKGDFYFRYKQYSNAKISYSNALNLQQYSNARVLRASCYLNLKQFDSCLIDLKSYPEYSKDNYWYIGNYYETIRKLDSAIHYYEMLYNENNRVYKYCKDRIVYLKTDPKPKLLEGLDIREAEKLAIQLQPIQ